LASSDATGLLLRRLASHRLAGNPLASPAKAVAWYGAVQSQDFPSSRAAVALRIRNGTDESVLKALKARKVVRTWALRGTLHLVAAQDIHWLLPLIGAGVIQRTASQNRKQWDLNDKTIPAIHKVLEAMLKGGSQLTRAEVYEGLHQHKIATDGLRGPHILYGAAHAGLICLGDMRGKQETYTLLSEWLPAPPGEFDEDEAMAELARRYFQSHGPATLEDFVFWSGLKVTQARAGLEMVEAGLMQETVNGKDFWFKAVKAGAGMPKRLLLPAFDEYLLGYRDRSAVLAPAHSRKVLTVNGLFKAAMLLDGKIVGTWSRVAGKGGDGIQLEPFTKNQATALP
jgi:hypothetical protein